MNTNKTLTNIPVYILIDTYAFLDYLDLLRAEVNDNEKSKILVDKAKKLSATLIDYQIPSIEIVSSPTSCTWRPLVLAFFCIAERICF